jgi:hypothetical protein
MIAPKKTVRSREIPADWHAPFLEMLPAIRKYAENAFYWLEPEARDDAVGEVIAGATVAYARLVELGKAELGYPSVLARFGVAQVRDGRRVGNRMRSGDVLSPYARRRKQFVVQHLDRFDKRRDEWRELLVEDTCTPVPDQVAFRIDFPDWLSRQTNRRRRIAEALAVGNTTSDVARRFGISAGRVSQLRQHFRRSWREFHGESPAPTAWRGSNEKVTV